MRKCKRSQLRQDRIGSYEGIALKLLKYQSKKHKPYGVFFRSKLLIGWQSTHKTQIGRNWRLFWRIKAIGRINFKNFKI